MCCKDDFLKGRSNQTFLQTSHFGFHMLKECKRRWQVRANGRFHEYISVEINSCLHRECFGLETAQIILRPSLQLEQEAAGLRFSLSRHMWIMDHFHSNSHVFAQVRGYRRRVWKSADVKLGMEWIHNELLRQENVYLIWLNSAHTSRMVTGVDLEASPLRWSWQERGCGEDGLWGGQFRSLFEFWISAFRSNFTMGLANHLLLGCGPRPQGRVLVARRKPGSTIYKEAS